MVVGRDVVSVFWLDTEDAALDGFALEVDGSNISTLVGAGGTVVVGEVTDNGMVSLMLLEVRD